MEPLTSISRMWGIGRTGDSSPMSQSILGNGLPWAEQWIMAPVSFENSTEERGSEISTGPWLSSTTPRPATWIACRVFQRSKAFETERKIERSSAEERICRVNGERRWPRFSRVNFSEIEFIPRGWLLVVRDENSGRIHTVYISYAEYKNDESCRSFRKFVYMDPCVCVCVYMYICTYTLSNYTG